VTVRGSKGSVSWKTGLAVCLLAGSAMGGGVVLAEGVDSLYISEIDRWHEERIESLTRPDGWLTLAGLFWLSEGENTFGTDASNDIVFPAGKAPDFLGSFFLRKGQVSMQIRPGVKVFHDGRPVQSLVLKDDSDGAPSVLEAGPLSWCVIKRGDRFAVRLKDRESPTLREFEGIERFPVDRKWRVEARLEPYDPPKTIPVPTVIGTVIEEHSPGALVFEMDGRSFRLDPIAESSDTDLFLVFGDETNGIETYGGGRFLVVAKPDSAGFTSIDFNKAYNPPCAFTPYATCPLPPEQNRLPFRVTAGEKSYAGYSH